MHLQDSSLNNYLWRIRQKEMLAVRQFKRASFKTENSVNNESANAPVLLLSETSAACFEPDLQYCGLNMFLLAFSAFVLLSADTISLNPKDALCANSGGGVKGAVDGSVVKVENTGGDTSCVSWAYGPVAYIVDDGPPGELADKKQLGD
nr:hypothetical protein L195_g055484 [Ipomoea batatas]